MTGWSCQHVYTFLFQYTRISRKKEESTKHGHTKSQHRGNEQMGRLADGQKADVQVAQMGR